MSAPIKIIIMLAVWLLWSFLAYEGALKQCCVSEGGTEVTEAPVTPDDTGHKRFPIDFQYAKADAFTNAGYAELKQRLVSEMKDKNILEVTGFYFESEPKPEGFENMGFARADKIRQLLIPDIPADRIRLRARLVDEPGAAKTGYFEASDYGWITPEEAPAKPVEELADRVIIRFPYNSTEKEQDASVDEYLNKLAERIKQSGEKVSLTGHTDNKGNPEYNLSLSDRRARQIRDILVKKGVKTDQLIVEAKGQTQPVDSNETDEGRHNNRRVEVRLIKN